jgi:hypothetical protein
MQNFSIFGRTDEEKSRRSTTLNPVSDSDIKVHSPLLSPNLNPFPMISPDSAL